MRTELFVTNGQVNAVVEAEGTIYIGGSFSYVGRATGAAVPLDASTGLPQGMPRVLGIVYAVEPDGIGGWYVAGQFTHVGGVPRSNIAHLQADHTVSAWNPSANSAVVALAVSGSTVYAGGGFTSIGGQARNRIAALDAGTGLASAWNPGAAGFVRALAVKDSTVYVGGDFTSIGGQGRFYLAALDTSTGNATGWDPSPSNIVRALAVRGGTVYACGNFTTIGGQSRQFIAALSVATGLATAWNPGPNGPLATMAVRDSTVYAGGSFTTIGGQSRNSIAAVHTGTGLATAWNPNCTGIVWALATNAGTVYAGGTFTSIGGQTRRNIAALDAGTGLATAWNPSAGAIVRTLAVSGSTVYVGGDFTSTGGLTRNNIAALDAATGAVTPWNPNASDTVRTLAVSGGKVYAGGSFTSIGGPMRNRIAALDVTTGTATAWDPNANLDVRALVVRDSTVYVGGDFATVGGQPRNRVAAISDSLEIAAVTAWNPGADGPVESLALGDSTVYAGGRFATIGGQSRSRIAELRLTTGVPTPWNPNVVALIPAYTVKALARSGSVVYAGGYFSTVGGQSRINAAALNVTTGFATAWSPNAGSGVVRALAVSGGVVYLGGDFTVVSLQPRSYLAATHPGTGVANAWNPNLNSSVNALVVSGGWVYAGGSFFSIDSLPRQSLAGIAQVPTIAGIAPDRGGDKSSTTVLISGFALRDSATAKLTRSGEADIPGSQVVVAADGRSISTTFDLTDAALGPWNVVVTNPDLQVATLVNGFTVDPSAPYEIRVNVIGPSEIRADRRRAYDIVLENLGNGDVLHVPLWISRIPAAATVELGFPLAQPPQEVGEPNWNLVPLALGGPGGKYVALVIPRLPPGISVRRIYLTVPSAVASFTLDAALAPPWVDGAVFRACLTGGGGITAPACMGAQLTAINDSLAATPGIQALSGIGLWAKIAWQCEGAATLPAAVAKAEQALDFMLPVEGAPPPAGCEVTLVPRWRDRRLVTIVTSVDPNDKLGAGGVGASRLIGSEQLLPYSIRFENLETASAPAQEVVVFDALDPATLDVSTVSLGPIIFGDHVVYPPPGLPSYETDVDLRPAQELIVRVAANLDAGTGVLSWSLTASHPLGRPLADDEGFLPPNVTPPEGEGSVLFTVMPKPGLSDSTTISNQATLVFDGSSLQTPEWSNVLDATAPESGMLPLPATTDSASFTVRWAANGSPPDLHDFSVYVSENGGAYRPWRAHTTATADTIGAPGGGMYAFYSLARDLSGNLEAAPETPDVETFSRVAVDERAPLRLALEGAAPNPTMGAARVWFTLPSREGAVLEVVDVAGRRVFKRDVGSLGPGRHAVDVGAAARRPGLYFLRLVQSGQTLRARMVVVR